MRNAEMYIVIPALSVSGLYLLHFLFQAFAGGKLKYKGNGIAVAVNLVAVMLSLFAAAINIGGDKEPLSRIYGATLSWTGIPALEFCFVFDNTSAIMLCLITLLTLVVATYSITYMSGEAERQRYWAYLSLFTGAMTGLVLSGSLFTLFIFWEGIGLASWLLIGFWRNREEAAKGSIKAFLVNRAADVFFLIGICLLFAMQDPAEGFGPFYIDSRLSPDFHWGVIFIFLGAAGKSAQFPFQAWLPGAMAGPTPISALLHAATMVAAGVYVMMRLSPLLGTFEENLIAAIGAGTALIGAFSALGQTNIKRVLAFSTVSQLGLMMFGIGTGWARSAGLHLYTHAFFKCGLFLVAGAIIYSLHQWKEGLEKKGTHISFDPEDMRSMGGLRKMMPKTFWLYIIFAASLAGLPFTAGFLSKENILSDGWNWAHNQGGWAWGATGAVWFTAFLTPLYLVRQGILVFGNKTRLPLPASGERPPDVKALMLIPMILLAAGCIGVLWEPLRLIGFWGEDSSWPFLVLPAKPPKDPFHFALLEEPLILCFSLLLLVSGVLTGWLLYRKGWTAKTSRMETNFIFTVSRNQLWFDEIYTFLIAKPALLIARGLYWMDRVILDGIVNGVATAMVGTKKRTPSLSRFFWRLDTHVFDWLVNGLAMTLWKMGGRLRRLQSGRLQAYLGLSLLGLLLLLGAFIYFVIS